MRFDRRISPAFEADVVAHPQLARFLQNPGALARVSTCPPPILDTQLRLGDVITLYAGTTKVLDLTRNGGAFRTSAHTTYVQQAPAGVFGAFPATSLTSCVEAWSAFCAVVAVGPAWLSEGVWQAWLARRASLGLHSPWAVLDREAQPEGVDATVQAWLAAQRKPWQTAAATALPRQVNALTGDDPGASPDFLAVLPSGDIALVEVKEGTSANGIYYGPIQVGGYVTLWRELLRQAPATVASLNGFIEQKQRLGLLSPDFPRIRIAPECIPVLVVGDANANSTVWGSGGLLDTVIRAASSAGAPLADLQVWVSSATDLRLRNVTATLTP